MSETAYPRPQLVREHWQSLNGQWKFTFDNNDQYRHASDPIQWTHEIQVPFPPESETSGIGDRGFHRACWYQREFEITPGEGRVLLHFGAVDYRAKVWVNGRQVADHEGGHSSFHADITSALGDAQRHTLTV